MIPLLVLLEIIILCLGATVFLYRPKMMVSEAICSGIIVALLTLSCLYQTVFLIGVPQLAFIFEAMLVIASVFLIRRRNNYLKQFWRRLVNFWQEHKITCSVVGIAIIYLGLQAIILPPTGPDIKDYHLSRVLLFQQEKSLYLENIVTLRQAIFPVGWNILNHAFLRFHTDYGLGIFPFLIYLSVGCGVYSLCRKLTSQNIAFVSTLVIITMPQVVFQSNSLSNDFPLAGVGIFCFLILYRLYQNINLIDFILLVVGSAFGLSIKLTFVLFLAPFLVFSGYLLFKKHSFGNWFKFLLNHWFWWIALIVPVLIFSQIWLYSYNYNYWGGFSGPPDYVNYFKQADGVKGGVANLFRFLFQSIDLMQPTDIVSQRFLNIQPSNELEKIYRKVIYPLVGDAGMLNNYLNPLKDSPYKFGIEWKFQEIIGWYGWFGFLLSIPSILYTSIKGNRFVKIVSYILICFFLIVSYKLAWSPLRGRYFSIFFVSSGICIAYTLDSLSLWLQDKTKILLKVITITCIITLYSSILMNEDRGILILNRELTRNLSLENVARNMTQNNVWKTTNFGQIRAYQTINQQSKDLIKPQAKIALLASYYDDNYDYILAFPNSEIVPIHASSYSNLDYKYPGLQSELTNYQFSNPLQSNPESFDYLLCLDVKCEKNSEELSFLSPKLIWHFQPSKQGLELPNLPEAQLFELN
ncbi:unknown [Crocosphaera subtropica ATCC 51142]|uniref:Glycosyltransferase RgtA/B/C/D-like domain-containing protein n=1 Tax=Crocosphaera subtropica (strain ATCC 51142 / BH68) TaxID=43989 RepID=B1WYB3_CROS5|nr:glycosyltransferase family 39 protein [Crocosphaera subtropica]ACB52697.1 unknown [Crocosphaera subtropica ATCC 51142]